MSNIFSSISKDNIASQRAYIIVFTLLVIWSLWSLVYSPIAWFDEVYFASATHSFISGNGLAVELDNYEPCVTYGPVYFLITGLVTKVFGFGMFQFRIVNCLFAFLCVIILGKVLERIKVKETLRYLFQLILLTDVLFVSNSHSGRMEFVALFFVLVAYLSYLKPQTSEISKTLVISIMLTLAIMTTPRVVVICIPIVILQFVNLIKSHSWLLIVVYCIIPIILYSIWIFAAFGSFDGMITHYTQHGNSSEVVQQSSFERFVGGNWAISKFHYPMLLAAILSVVLLIKNKKFKEIALYVLPILIYYFLVKDTGMYGVLILSFYMILLALAASELFIDKRKFIQIPYKALIALCLLLNVSVFGVKAFAVISTLDQRDPSQPSEWISKNIPEGSRVAGDYDYYYAAIENECRFRRVTNEFVKDEDFLKDIIVTYNPDYIILRKSHQKISEMPLFVSSGYEKISELDYDNGSKMFQNIQKLTNISFTSSYSGCIYKKTVDNLQKE